MLQVPLEAFPMHRFVRGHVARHDYLFAERCGPFQQGSCHGRGTSRPLLATPQRTSDPRGHQCNLSASRLRSGVLTMPMGALALSSAALDHLQRPTSRSLTPCWQDLYAKVELFWETTVCLFRRLFITRKLEEHTSDIEHALKLRYNSLRTSMGVRCRGGEDAVPINKNIASRLEAIHHRARLRWSLFL